jgi:hypothetical protein
MLNRGSMNALAGKQESARARSVLALLLLALVAAPAVEAFVVNIAQGNPREIYMQVGAGAFTGGTFVTGGVPANNPTINRVTVTVPANDIGTGTNVPMTTDLASGVSYYDGRVFCNVPGQLYVGGYFRRPGNSQGVGVILTVNAPANLVNADGETMPMSEVGWTASGIGDTGAQPFPSGTFTGGTQTIGSLNRNRWGESCHSFFYRNTAPYAPGTYVGRVVYTLAIF